MKFEALSKDASLDILLPRVFDIDVLEIIRDGSFEDVQRLPSRRNLFFGRKADASLFDHQLMGCLDCR